MRRKKVFVMAALVIMSSALAMEQSFEAVKAALASYNRRVEELFSSKITELARLQAEYQKKQVAFVDHRVFDELIGTVGRANRADPIAALKKRLDEYTDENKKSDVDLAALKAEFASWQRLAGRAAELAAGDASLDAATASLQDITRGPGRESKSSISFAFEFLDVPRQTAVNIKRCAAVLTGGKDAASILKSTPTVCGGKPVLRVLGETLVKLASERRHVLASLPPEQLENVRAFSREQLKKDLLLGLEPK